MALDGLLPKPLGHLDKRGNPIYSIIFSCTLTAGLALVFGKDILVDATTIGTLVGFAIICGGLLVTRLQREPKAVRSGTISVALLFVACFMTWIVQALCHQDLKFAVFVVGSVGTILPCIVYLCYLFYRYRATLYRTPDHQSEEGHFICPFVPGLPILCIVIITYLVVIGTDIEGVALFSGWTLIGFIVYFAYGIHSSLLQKQYCM